MDFSFPFPYSASEHCEEYKVFWYFPVVRLPDRDVLWVFFFHYVEYGSLGSQVLCDVIGEKAIY